MRALPPSVDSRGEVVYAAPTDGDRGGTWIGVNEAGITHCLLNAYEHTASSAFGSAAGERSADGQSAREGPATRPSRGEIVREVQCALDRSHTYEILESRLKVGTYPPFYLLRIAPDGAVLFFWDGALLRDRGSVSPPVTTSSYRPEQVREWRENVFTRVIGNASNSCPSPRRLFRFQRTRNRRYPAFGPCMSRSDARTVSLTHISVRLPDFSPAFAKPDVRIGYFDGPPSRIRSLPDPDRLVGDTLVPETAVDIPRMFAERAPHIVRRLPPGLLGLLRPLLRIGLLNAGLHRLAHMDVGSMFEYVLDRLGVNVRIEGIEQVRHIPRPVVACNHPTGGIEGMAMILSMVREWGDIALPANEMLSRIVPLRPHIVPVDRYRGNAAVARAFNDLFSGDRPVLVFPAGRTARERGGRLREYPWRKSFVAAARKYDRSIIPVWVSGTNSRLFRGIYRARTALNINLNIEMLLLVRELFKRKGEELVIRFGPPIPPDELASAHRRGQTDAGIAARIQRSVERNLSRGDRRVGADCSGPATRAAK